MKKWRTIAITILGLIAIFLFPLNFIIFFAPMISYSVWQSSLKWLDEFLKAYLALSRFVPFFRREHIHIYIYLGVATWLASLTLSGTGLVLILVDHFKKK